MSPTKPDGFGTEKVHDPENAVVDICFIHGLGGGQFSTWTTGDVFWPRDLLSRDIPDARILAWGYDATIAHFWSGLNSTVDDHAKKLSADLGDVREGTKTLERPIIFIAHSLGGLVCARSLLTAPSSEAESTRGVPEHTRGLAFIGTPFQGSDKTKWAQTGKKVMELLSLTKTNKEVLDHLEDKSVKLATLGDEFPRWLLRRREDPKTAVSVVCFFEELSSPIGVIVSSTSAQIGGYDRLPIHADHTGMCKYTGSDDSNYISVLSVLRRWVEGIKTANTVKEPQSGSTYTSNSTITGPNYGGNQQGQANLGLGTQNIGTGGTFTFGPK